MNYPKNLFSLSLLLSLLFTFCIPLFGGYVPLFEQHTIREDTIEKAIVSKSIALRAGTRVMAGSALRATIENTSCQLISTTCTFPSPLVTKNTTLQSTILDTVSNLRIYLYDGWSAGTYQSATTYTNWYSYKEQSGSYIVRNDSTQERPAEYSLYADTTYIYDEHEQLVKTIPNRSLVKLKRNFVEIYTDSADSVNIPDITNQDITLYPQPNTDRITLSSSSAHYVEIMSLTGEVVLSTKLTEPTFSTANLPVGTYYARITTAQGIVVKPFVIVR